MRWCVTVDLENLSPWVLGVKLGIACAVALAVVVAEVVSALALLRWLA